jgi:hypothetical protein
VILLQRPVRLLLAMLVAPTTTPACRAPIGDDVWEPAVVRAVARQVQASQPPQEVRVLSRVGGPAGPQLSWGVRQALTTAGIEVVDAVPAAGEEQPDAALLVLERSWRDGAEWVVDGRLEGAAELAAHPLSWRVRCVDAVCEAAEPAARDPGLEEGADVR